MMIMGILMPIVMWARHGIVVMHACSTVWQALAG
jgi:hypothetical protein